MATRSTGGSLRNTEGWTRNDPISPSDPNPSDDVSSELGYPAHGGPKGPQLSSVWYEG